jgi:hypothetical protein
MIRGVLVIGGIRDSHGRRLAQLQRWHLSVERSPFGLAYAEGTFAGCRLTKSRGDWTRTDPYRIELIAPDRGGHGVAFPVYLDVPTIRGRTVRGSFVVCGPARAVQS